MSEIELMTELYDFLCTLVPRMTVREKIYFADITKEFYGEYDDVEEWEKEEDV